jgi:hypothetical protein
MTILVFNCGDDPVVTSSWSASGNQGEMEIVFLCPEPRMESDIIKIAIGISEFLTLIADAGKVLDLRKLQEGK